MIDFSDETKNDEFQGLPLVFVKCCFSAIYFG